MKFDGAICVVTGAAGGIGRYLCEQLMAQRAIVYGIDRNLEALNVLAENASKNNWDFHPHTLDITDEKAVTDFRDQTVAKQDRIDLWINNAGIALPGTFLEVSHKDFCRVIAVNLEGVALGTRVALEVMEARGSGVIVNMASVAGHVAAPFLAAYTASKHGVVGFSRTLQEELRMKDSNVKVITVCPGFVDTPLLQKGEKLGFPEWISFILSTPEKVSREILNGVRREKSEIFPTANGKWIMRINKVFPHRTAQSTRLLLTKKFRDVILNRYTK